MATDSIRAEVVFESPTVFGGDDVRAVITFRNVSKAASGENPDTRTDVRHSTDTRNRSDSFRNSNNSRNEDQPRASVDGWRDRFFGLLSTDYEPLPSNRLSRARSVRRTTQPPVRSPHGTSETLIMGTCRIEGHFVVDPEVVDVARLEHVRNRGAAMGLAHLSEVDDSNDVDNPQGITKMIWGLLGDESTGHQNTPAHSSDSGEGLPIYSSASSLLFPALTLNPGESKAFYYKCTLPRELPPSYRGKAVRIYYSLVVSTQRGESRLVDPSAPNGDSAIAKPSLKSRAHRLVAPFRVFQYVDDDGDSIPHQVDNPIGGDQSAVTVKELPDSSRETMSNVFGLHHSGPSTKPGPKSREQLLDHIKALRTSHDPYASHDQTLDDEEDDAGTSAGAHINRLVQSNGLISKTLVPKTTFHISRNSKYIATLSLSKPLYRIGDSMVLSFDFSGSQTPCYHVTASLETTETIHRSYLHGYDWDDSLLSGWGNASNNNLNSGNGRRSSVGSDGSGRRLSGSRDPTMIPLPSTRRIYAQEMTFIYDSRDRVTFDMVVPATAASQFATTKICMDWSLKLTFVTHFADKKGAQMLGSSKSNLPNNPSTVQANIPRPAVSEPGSPVMERKRSIAGDFTFPNMNGHGNPPANAGSPGNILNITDSAVIAPVDYDSRGTTYGPKDSFSCEHFSCKIPLNIYSTDKDISSVIGVSRGTSVYSAGLW